MDMDHSGPLEKQGNLNLSRRLSRDGDRIGTGQSNEEGTTQELIGKMKTAGLSHCSITGTGTKPSAI
jgi:hypothetical protein